MNGSTPAAADRPLLSVVMIAYNVERYVAQALDSVLMQQLEGDYEIVVGEDASTDGTGAIVADYARRHPRIRLLRRERNLGMNRNFMETLLAARGRFIALLDADDYWTSPHKLRAQIDFLESHPECSICFHNAMVVYEDQAIEPHPFHVPEPRHLLSHHVPKPFSSLADLAGGNFMQTCSVVFRAGLYGDLPPWYLSMPTFDWPLHLLNAEHGLIGYIDGIMGVYRVHSGSFWSTNMAHFRRIDDVEAMIDAYRMVNAYTGFRYDRTIRGQVLPLHNRAAELAIAAGDYRRATSHALAALTGARRGHARFRSAALKQVVACAAKGVAGR